MKRHSPAAANQTASEALQPGDLSPGCVLPDTKGNQINLRSDSLAGNPLVLVFCPRFTSSAREVVSGLSQVAGAISAEGARIFVISSEWDNSLTTTFHILLDLTGRSFAAFGVERRSSSIIVLRRNYHVAAVLTGKPERLVNGTLSALRKMAWERETTMMRMHPPVLQIPEVLSGDDCLHLIDIFEKRGQVFVDPQPIQDFMKGSDFKMRIPENGRIDRIDHFFFEADTLAFLNSRLNRVWPEIFKAFHFQISKYETLRLAKYEGERRGVAHGHRDNNQPTPYRRFAMSINLNTSEFEGGELRFPEFGDQRYRPDGGTAIVFSSSLLHEAMHVTQGQRYVLLAFLL